MNEPLVLLMDEPLANLDSLTRIAMQTELMPMWQRESFTAFMVTHELRRRCSLRSACLC